MHPQNSLPLIIVGLLAAGALAQESTVMKGFPAADDEHVTLENWQRAPYNRWAFRNARRLLPSAEVGRGAGPVHRFARRPRNLDRISFEGADGKTMTVAGMLASTFTDGFLVLHRGTIITERYFNAVRPETKHILWSVSKSFTGSLTGILVEKGLVDPDARVTRYVPELEKSAYGDATIRQLLDMTIGIHFNELYSDPDNDVIRLDIANGWLPRTNPEVPHGLYNYLPTMKKEGKHGKAFKYVSANTDVLGWVLERATNTYFAELFSREIWSKIGAEHDGYVLLDGLGTCIADAGFNVTLRDLARFGQMHLQHGLFNGQQIVPTEWIADFATNGDRKAWALGQRATDNPDGFYRSQWWMTGNTHGAFAARGIHGQTIYIDPAADMVIAKFSSYPTASLGSLDRNQSLAFEAIANEIMKR